MHRERESPAAAAAINKRKEEEVQSHILYTCAMMISAHTPQINKYTHTT